MDSITTTALLIMAAANAVMAVLAIGDLHDEVSAWGWSLNGDVMTPLLTVAFLVTNAVMFAAVAVS